MRQAFVPSIGKIDYREVPVPEVAADQVLIRVERVGICGSDQHVFHGHHPLVQPPLVQGHEFAGRIEAVGAGVSRLQQGQLVTVQPAIGCGKCRNCRDGLPGQCYELDFIGGNLEGAMADFIAVPEAQVFAFPEGVKAEDAAMSEPLAVAVRALNLAGSVDGATVFVAGGGTIGQLVARVARHKGAKKVVVSDINPHRRAVAEAAGCIALNPTAAGGFMPAFAAATGEKFAAKSFECVGNAPALVNCLEVLPRRGMLIVCGVFGKPTELDMVKVQDQEITVQGSLMYSWDDFAEAVDLIADGALDLASVQTHHVGFDGILDAYELLDQKATLAIKVFVDIS